MMMRDALEVGPWDKWAKTLIHAIPHIPQKSMKRLSYFLCKCSKVASAALEASATLEAKRTSEAKATSEVKATLPI